MVKKVRKLDVVTILSHGISRLPRLDGLTNEQMMSVSSGVRKNGLVAGGTFVLPSLSLQNETDFSVIRANSVHHCFGFYSSFKCSFLQKQLFASLWDSG